MAKIAFTKLGLGKNQEVKTFVWNDQTIEVKQYLPINEVIELVSTVINLSHDMDSNFSNPIKVELYTTLNVLFNYTNINFTEKQKEDAFKLYDLVIGSGLYQEIINLIPEDEYKRLNKAIKEGITAIYAYQNSIVGLLDTVSTDYNNLNLEATDIQSKLADPNNMAFLKNILAELG